MGHAGAEAEVIRGTKFATILTLWHSSSRQAPPTRLAVRRWGGPRTELRSYPLRLILLIGGGPVGAHSNPPPHRHPGPWAASSGGGRWSLASPSPSQTPLPKLYPTDDGSPGGQERGM